MSAKVWKEYDLDNVAIEKISEDVQSYMKEIGEESRNIHRNRLVIEELLLRIKDSSDEVKKICVLIGRQYGRHVFRMTYNGVAFDPTSNEESSFILLETIGLVPMWGYKRGQNAVSMTLSGRAKKGRLFKILLAVVVAGALGYLGTFMPVGIKQGIDESLLTPLINCFLGLLSTFSGFMIALTISSGVLGVGDASTFSRIGKKVISRFFIFTMLAASVALLASYPFFELTMGESGGASFKIKELTGMFFDIIPSNPIDPFSTGNSLQIIVIGLFVGVGLLVLGERTKSLVTFVREGTTLTQWLTSTVCSVVPVFVFVALLHQIWGGRISALLTVWKPLLIVAILTIVWGVIVVIFTSIRVRISPIKLVKKIFPAYILALSTGSSMMAFTTGMEVCEKKLGVEPSYVRFSYPMGNVMYMQGTVIYLVVISMFFAETYGLKVGLMWLVMTVVTAGFLAIAVPPIPGAAIMLFTVLFSQLGIPQDALVMATAMDVVADFFDAGANVFLMILEITDGANSMKQLNHEVLNK